MRSNSLRSTSAALVNEATKEQPDLERIGDLITQLNRASVPFLPTFWLKPAPCSTCGKPPVSLQSEEVTRVGEDCEGSSPVSLQSEELTRVGEDGKGNFLISQLQSEEMTRVE